MILFLFYVLAIIFLVLYAFAVRTLFVINSGILLLACSLLNCLYGFIVALFYEMQMKTDTVRFPEFENISLQAIIVCFYYSGSAGLIFLLLRKIYMLSKNLIK